MLKKKKINFNFSNSYSKHWKSEKVKFQWRNKKPVTYRYIILWYFDTTTLFGKCMTLKSKPFFTSR